MKKYLGSILIGATIVGNVQAASEEALLKVQNTTRNLIEALVADGVLTPERADELIKQAEQEAEYQIEQEERSEAQAPEKVIRVPYVPKFMEDQIREGVRADLRQDVVGDVLTQAKTERWGVPGTTPAWIDRIKVSGDIRLRAESESFSSNNRSFTTGDTLTYIDFQEANESGAIFPPLNITEDRQRFRYRARLKVSAKVTQKVKATIRLATGNTSDPVSLNETMGDHFSPDSIVIDQAYLRYDDYTLDGFNWMTLSGGRMVNPFFSTDLVWDSDLAFEGLASTFRWNASGDGGPFATYEENKTVFFTLGAFPVQEVEVSSDDKWLIATQIGGVFIADDQSVFELGLAYYDYQNMEGVRNSFGSTERDFTAPEYLQGGNTLFPLGNSDNGNDIYSKFGLTTDYDLLNLTMRYDLARFAPMHLIVTADYVKNIGYEADRMQQRANANGLFVNGTFDDGDPEDEQTEGYSLDFTFGWTNVAARGNWQGSLAYKYLERDAVIDAFTDSDFHAIGTNAKGWIISGSYGLFENTWMKVKYYSTDEIDGPPLGRDLLQIDLNAAF